MNRGHIPEPCRGLGRDRKVQKEHRVVHSAIRSHMQDGIRLAIAERNRVPGGVVVVIVPIAYHKNGSLVTVGEPE